MCVALSTNLCFVQCKPIVLQTLLNFQGHWLVVGARTSVVGDICSIVTIFHLFCHYVFLKLWAFTVYRWGGFSSAPLGSQHHIRWEDPHSMLQMCWDPFIYHFQHICSIRVLSIGFGSTVWLKKAPNWQQWHITAWYPSLTVCTPHSSFICQDACESVL